MKIKLPYILLLSLLTGCNKLMPALSGSTTTGTPDYSRTLFVGAGQSNMASEHLSDTFLFSKNVALGATSISQWQKGTPLYAGMKDAIGSYSNTVILFWQGESDGLYGSGGDQWANQFIQMVRDIRHDTGFALPVIYVMIGTTTLETADWQAVRDQQVTAQTMAPLLRMLNVDALGTPLGDRQIHYSQDQYRIVQKEMLKAYVEMMKGGSL